MGFEAKRVDDVELDLVSADVVLTEVALVPEEGEEEEEAASESVAADDWNRLNDARGCHADEFVLTAERMEIDVVEDVAGRRRADNVEKELVAAVRSPTLPGEQTRSALDKGIDRLLNIIVLAKVVVVGDTRAARLETMPESGIIKAEVAVEVEAVVGLNPAANLGMKV